MSTCDTPDPSSFPHRLVDDAYRHLVHSLLHALPPPPGANPEDVARRDHAAIAQIAGLAPGNAAEAELAGQFVAASEQWKYCLRLARHPQTAPEPAPTGRGTPEAPPDVLQTRCHAQTLAMMRQANSALRLLLQLQDRRSKLEGAGVAANRLAWTEHRSASLMAQAPAPAPAPAGAADPPAMPLASASAPCSDAAPACAGAAACSANGPAQPKPSAESRTPAAPVEESDLIAEAEQYAVIYPERAALIRRLGRVPDDVSFGPPDDSLVQALVTARSPALAALDQAFADARCLA